MPGFIKPSPHQEVLEPPTVLSPFAQFWGDILHLLGGRYPSVIALMDSRADPLGLSSTSAIASFEESWQVATSPCCPRDLPDDISANPSSDAWSPTPAGPTECLYLLLPLCHRPSPSRDWVGFPLRSANTIFRGRVFEAADIPLCSGLRVCSPPRSFLPLCSSHRAAEAFTFGLNVLRCLRTHRIC